MELYNMVTENLFGEFGIFPMQIQIPCIAQEKEEESETEKIKKEDRNYLQKGEKILSLLRKKQHKEFRQDRILEGIKPRWERTKETLARRIGADLEKKFLEMMAGNPGDEDGLKEAIRRLSVKLPVQVTVKTEERSRSLELISYLCQYDQKAILRISYGEKDVSVPVGAAFAKRHEPLCKFKSDTGPYIEVANFRTFIGELYLRKYVLDQLRKMKAEAGDEERYSQIPAIGKLRNAVLEKRKNAELSQMKKREDWHSILLFYLETEEAGEAVLKADGLYLNHILIHLQDDYRKEKEEFQAVRKISSDYAKSFQTKKNIPGKCIQAMRKSGFNRYFGYVEFDEECDLSNMEELYWEYDAFARELGIPAYEEVSLRFRKLGNHRAEGLYYPALKCLCVDVRSPGAMIHEAGHMIDYHLGHISAKYMFQNVYDRYKTLLERYISSSKEEQVKVLKGNTKYNRNYYLRPTEVFARCLEMYVIRIRHIDNSLCREKKGFMYPEDEEMNRLLGDFFDTVFAGMAEKRRKGM